jgi:hypothetical protein
MDETNAQTNVFYFKHQKSSIIIRCSCTLFAAPGSDHLHSIQINVTLIKNNKMTHLERLDIGSGTKMRVFDNFVQNLKETIFGCKFIC